MRELIFSARRKDFRVDTFAAGGPGGQHSNKSQTGVRITHLATGISVESRETRSQEDNKKRAFQRLAALLVAKVKEDLAARHGVTRSTEVIRTYHGPDNRVKDHASGMQRTYREVVINGDLGELIEARRRAAE